MLDDTRPDVEVWQDWHENGAPADSRRVVVIDPATDSVTTIIGKASAAPGVGELRERIGLLVALGGHLEQGRSLGIADSILRVLIGEAHDD